MPAPNLYIPGKINLFFIGFQVQYIFAFFVCLTKVLEKLLNSFNLVQLCLIFKPSTGKCHSKPANSYPFFSQWWCLPFSTLFYPEIQEQKLPLKLDWASPKLKKLMIIFIYLYVCFNFQLSKNQKIPLHKSPIS